MKLYPHFVDKPWGRSGVAGLPAKLRRRRIGEVWHAAPGGEPLPLLVKHLFTSERLSVQVHPDDDQARARGLAGGKSECWYILDAEPGASLALGLRREASAAELRDAALDGSIEALLAWKTVRPGDFFYVPAGTIHAIGAGISLVEVQQPNDVTYRLYDYGRPRELHLEDGLAVASRTVYPRALTSRASGVRSRILLSGPHFSMLALAGATDALAERDRFVVVLDGRAEAAGDAAGPGECLFVPGGARVAVSKDALVLLAAAGACAAVSLRHAA